MMRWKKRIQDESEWVNDKLEDEVPGMLNDERMKNVPDEPTAHEAICDLQSDENPQNDEKLENLDNLRDGSNMTGFTTLENRQNSREG